MLGEHRVPDFQFGRMRMIADSSRSRKLTGAVSPELRCRGVRFLSSTDLLQGAIMPITTTRESRTKVCGLGEVALRVNSLDAMQQFYEEVIRLPLMTRVPNCAFFKVADGYGGHTQVLALFDRSKSPGYRGTDAATSTIDHISFEIPLSDFENELKRLRALGLDVETAEHAWVHWRSLYVTDPEGNQVELVCYDESV